MAYIGRDIEYGSFTKQTLTADSSTLVFTLDQSVLDANNLLVSVGGVIQEPGVAYTASGTTLTFTGTPVSGDPIWIVYLGKSLGLSSERDAVTYQTATGDGSATTVAMTSAGTTGTIIVTLNGVMQTPSTDFSVSGTTLTFTTAPFSGAAIGIYYVGKKAKLGVPATDSIAVVDIASSGTFPAWDGSALTGIVGVMKSDILEMQNNIALLNFLRSNDSTTKRLSMLNGFNDMFRNTTGVAGEGVSVSMAHFDGTDIYLVSNNAHKPGFISGKSFLINFWVRYYVDGETGYVFHTGAGNSMSLFRDTDNKIRIQLGNTSGTTIADVKSTNTITASDGAQMVTVAINMAASSATDRIQMRIGTNAVETLSVTTSPTDTTVGLGTSNTQPSVGSDASGAGRTEMDLGRFYITEQYLDISVAANYAKLITTSGYPVDIGTNGVAVTGTTPKMLLNATYQNPSTSPNSWFNVNSGTGGTGTTDNNFYPWPTSNQGQRINLDGGYVNNKIYSSNSFTNSYELLDHYEKSNASNYQPITSFSDQSAWGTIYLTGSTGESISRVGWMLYKDGPATGNCYAQVWTTTGTFGSGMIPLKMIAQSAPINAATVSTPSLSTSSRVYNFEFPRSVPLDASTNYAVTFWYDNPPASNAIIRMWHDSTDFTVSPHNVVNYPANHSGWVGSTTNREMIYYIYGNKNVDLITKGTDSLAEVSSPASAPTKGHLEVLVDDDVDIILKEDGTSTTGYGTYNTSEFQFAQRFFLPNDVTLSSVEIYFKGGGNINMPAGVTASIQTANVDGLRAEANPSGTLVHANATKRLTNSTLANDSSFHKFDFDDFSLASGHYFLVIVPDGTINFGTYAAWGALYPSSATGDGTGFRRGNSSNVWDTPNKTVSFLFKVNGTRASNLVINTDIIGEISRDGGTTYSPAVLSRIPKVINGSSYEILAGDVDFTGDPSGTNLVGRIRTVNKHKVTVNGIAVNWI